MNERNHQFTFNGCENIIKIIWYLSKNKSQQLSVHPLFICSGDAVYASELCLGFLTSNINISTLFESFQLIKNSFPLVSTTYKSHWCYYIAIGDDVNTRPVPMCVPLQFISDHWSDTDTHIKLSTHRNVCALQPFVAVAIGFFGIWPLWRFLLYCGLLSIEFFYELHYQLVHCVLCTYKLMLCFFFDYKILVF